MARGAPAADAFTFDKVAAALPNGQRWVFEHDEDEGGQAHGHLIQQRQCQKQSYPRVAAKHFCCSYLRV